MHASIVPGLVGTAETIVTFEQTAQALGSGLVPVYGTPSLIALLEQAAVNALIPHLEAGKTSVGLRVQVQHMAPTPVGMAVRATATLAAVDGRRLTFHVSAYDDVEQVAGGSHERVIVDEERFVVRAMAKGGSGGVD
jgi:predicted thioesterase